MKGGEKLSLAFTFYNEEENIPGVIDSIAKALDSSGTDYELVLVDNGSADRTGEKLDGLARGNSRMKTVRLGRNRGYGGGIFAGLSAASGDFVGYMCGDGQIDAADVPALYRKMLSENCDLCKVLRVTRKDSLARKVISWAYNAAFRALFGTSSQDINGTPKLIRRDWLGKLDIKSRDWFIDAEIMIKSGYLGMKVSEMPVTFYPRKKGKSSVGFSTVLEFAKNAFKLFFRELKEWEKLKDKK